MAIAARCFGFQDLILSGLVTRAAWNLELIELVGDLADGNLVVDESMAGVAKFLVVGGSWSWRCQVG